MIICFETNPIKLVFFTRTEINFTGLVSNQIILVIVKMKLFFYSAIDSGSSKHNLHLYTICLYYWMKLRWAASTKR